VEELSHLPLPYKIDKIENKATVLEKEERKELFNSFPFINGFLPLRKLRKYFQSRTCH